MAKRLVPGAFGYLARMLRTVGGVQLAAFDQDRPPPKRRRQWLAVCTFFQGKQTNGRGIGRQPPSGTVLTQNMLGFGRDEVDGKYVARDPKLATCTTPKDRSGFSPRPKHRRWTVYSMTEVARSTPQVSGVVTRAQGSVCSSRQQWHDGLQIFCCSDDPCEGRLFRIEIRRLESACALGRKDASSSSRLPLVKRSSLAKQEPKTMRFFRNRLMRLCIERSGGHRCVAGSRNAREHAPSSR